MKQTPAYKGYTKIAKLLVKSGAETGQSRRRVRLETSPRGGSKRPF